MKYRSVAACLALVIILMFVASCSAENKFTYNGSTGAVVDSKSGVSYLVNFSYESQSRGIEPYASVSLGGAEETKLYKIGDLDPKSFLADGDGYIYHSTSVKLPTLAEMDADSIYVCDGVSYNFVVVRLEDKAIVSEIVKAYLEGESIDYPAIAAENSYKLKFESKEHSAFFYNLLYIEYPVEITAIDENGESYSCGKNFIYNRFERRCVPVYDLVSKHIPGSAS